METRQQAKFLTVEWGVLPQTNQRLGLNNPDGSKLGLETSAGLLPKMDGHGYMHYTYVCGEYSTHMFLPLVSQQAVPLQ